MKNNHIALFSGGTGGHVIPAVNFGNYLINTGYKCTLFLDKRGFQYADKFKGKVIFVSSAHFSGNTLFKLCSLFLLAYGLIQSFYQLFKIRPSHCFGFGSYASSMPLIVALMLKKLKLTKIYLHEQNSIIGKVNLFFASFADNIFINYGYILNLKPQYVNKTHHVGMPNNAEIIYKKRNTRIHNKNNTKILIYGGSQGSLNLINGFVKIIKKLPNSYFKKLKIFVQCSNDQKSNIEVELNNLQIDFELKSFFHNINEILYSSDIVVARSGAGTIKDIIFSQTPSILVPLPQSINNHQYVNAKYLLDKQAAKLVEEKDFDSDIAYSAFKKLFDNIDQRISIIRNLQQIEILNANELMLKKVF